MESNQNRRFALLLVDDEPAVLAALKRVFRKAPYVLHAAENGQAALEILRRTPIDAALVDLMMPEMDGMTLLSQMQAKWPTVRVVILTGHGGVAEAVAAIKMGAVDFLQKPFEEENLLARLEQLHRIWQLEQENRRLRAAMEIRFGFDQLTGQAEAMLNLKRMILQVAPSDASILIQGETGTGKELVARAIHHHSPRGKGPFVPVDCAGINETVMASELFGHVRGAFTGAHESTAGLVRSADKGTLFLDEVGELSLSMQVKLLRTIQEKEVRPVGAGRSHPVDVRILAATNRNLEQEVAAGRFRQDLYYRLNVVVMTVPPLRDRLDDVPLLVRHFIERFRTPASPVHRITKQALLCLMAYDWPGNVRELENALRRAVAMGQEERIGPADLPENIHAPAPTGAATGVPGQAAGIEGDSLEVYEAAAIRNALTKSGGNRRKAAGLLQIGEATLYRKLKKYGIDG
ncbi:sigma-54-dependent transcriptional regulator [Desulfatitalea alkaliphila]|uniref:Sigma-54 dependent transcriptional regulator n=1 Tax=Desulfatitalea alkaliphila TaxID=2929485 RepID=A0AA41R5B3_9BACT|nr:sigma-54 dependent transcriptional regulator [Desulfatitalea alkaliphila]MCJ8501738.1 sigma-54 dependent transcriptional regulator [Desulfatitalea alkaliphila]